MHSDWVRKQIETKHAALYCGRCKLVQWHSYDHADTRGDVHDVIFACNICKGERKWGQIHETRTFVRKAVDASMH